MRELPFLTQKKVVLVTKNYKTKIRSKTLNVFCTLSMFDIG